MKKTIILLLTLSFILPAFSQSRWAVVTISAACAQNGPEYTSPVETQMLMGSVVEVLETRGYWVRVRAEEPPYEAWVNELALSRKDDGEISEYMSADKYIFVELSGDILTEPRQGAARICDFSLGGLVRVAKDSRGRVIKKGAYRGVILPSGKIGYVEGKSVEEFKKWGQRISPTAGGVIAVAEKLIGTPYVWGGCASSGLDCSGLTRLAFYMNGILLPRNVSQQVKCGVEVPLNNLVPGDLLFFGTEATPEKPSRLNHVAIYIGDGRFIHSSQVVRISSIDPGLPDSYDRQPVCARRIIGAVGTEYSLSSYYFQE